jgi:hypothetical protein
MVEYYCIVFRASKNETKRNETNKEGWESCDVSVVWLTV